jgi:hypothetical protein
MDEPRSHVPQIIGSLLVAVAIVAIVIIVVTAKLGPTSIAELEVREDRIDAREDALDDRLDAREDAREDRLND